MYTSSIDRIDGLSYSGLRSDSRTTENSSTQEAEKTRVQARRASMYTANNTMSGIAREVEAALAGVEPDSNGRITFKQLEAHKGKMESEFAEKVKTDLRALGVDEKIEFRLVSDNNGGVSVLSDSKDAALVERYFKANPKMVDEFNKIQMIGNFDRARQFQDRPVTDMRKEIQMQGAALFMSSAMNNGMSLASELMDFNAEGYTSGMFGLSRTI
ncbi:hypothetical protein LN040_01595 [Desulfovibrio subterraneus]|jgi:hypothetical protein|uniref:Uncharacterized protein n=1 Tax=Desulfovibrio subterraneus TaxID=2718620 RepID=A0A7J0BJ30_9BACT|nr:hypothetical protein [Desulfovibrio subterraneus]WBF67827.1 hypothetical protein LN040_01595 [Desulfovibrio subterraneus]GFM33670.1 hypothetical protein DSM101010T_20350 [Desulfovibrio subterraneus]